MRALSVEAKTRSGRRRWQRTVAQALKFCLLLIIVIVVNLPIITMILNCWSVLACPCTIWQSLNRSQGETRTVGARWYVGSTSDLL